MIHKLAGKPAVWLCNIDKRSVNALKTSHYLTARISMLPSTGYELSAFGLNAKAQARANAANKSKKQSLM